MENFGAHPTHPYWLSHSRITSSILFDQHGPTLSIATRNDGAELRPAKRDPSYGLILRARIASSLEHLAAASTLVESRYAWRGYSTDAGRKALPTGVTLVATQDALITGTLVLRPDGPAGLAADESFGDAMDISRNRGRRICQASRLAIDAAADWRSTLGALVGLAYLIARVVHEATDVFIEVSSRHERFYRRMFGFVEGAGPRFCPRVGVPAVLLRVELECLGETLAELGILPRLVFGAGMSHALAA
jgi:hypothetical protein